jgi:hypothetical protein
LAANSTVLAKFTNVSELLAYLHSPRSSDYACPETGAVIAALVGVGASVADWELIHSVLVLALAPTIHRTYREVCTWFRELEPEDVGQQILTFFLELIASANSENLVGILPIALSRGLRKTSFRWAEKEQRALLKRQEAPADKDRGERAAEPSFESISVLDGFLGYCSRQGLLSRFERELLLKFKVDGFSAKEIQDRHTVLSESAVHLRVHRIMQRLQDVALAPGAKTGRRKTASAKSCPLHREKAPQP